MPMARMAMYRKGVNLYIAPTADARDSWVTTLQHIAMEGRCFVLGCNQFVRKTDYPEPLQKELENYDDIMCRGGSMIISPQGKIIEGPLSGREGMLGAELDMNDVVKSKLDFDVVGHYSRDDIFNYEIEDLPETINLV